MSIDLNHAKAALSHRLAACVHMMLAVRGLTAEELKDKLNKFPEPHCLPAVVDWVLSATQADKIHCTELSDIAWALGFEWEFTIKKPSGPVPSEEQPAASADD